MKPASGIVVGGFIGFFVALLMEWLGLNLVYNLYDVASLIIWLYLILGLVCVLLGALLILTKLQKHAMLGAFLMVFGFKLMNWSFGYLIPIYDWDYGEWFSFGWWGWF